MFVNTKEPELPEETECEATRPLTPELNTKETRPLEESKPEDDDSLRLRLEEQDEDNISLTPETKETDSAGPLTQSFAAYGFNPFKHRPEE